MAIGERVLSDNVVLLPATDMPAHPLADLFQLIEGQQFDELVASIRENGQFDAIVLLDGAILDGQHRLWAVIESKTPVETIIIRGIAREAFATIDTVRAPRSGGDIIPDKVEVA